MSEGQRAFVLTQIERLTEDDLARIIYLKGCTELEGQKNAVKLFLAIEKKHSSFSMYLESIAKIFGDIGRKDLAREVDTFNLTYIGAEEQVGSIIKRVQSENASRRMKHKDPETSLPARIDHYSKCIHQSFSDLLPSTASRGVREELCGDSVESTSDFRSCPCTLTDRDHPCARRLSPIQSDHCGERLEPLVAKRHADPANASDIETIVACGTKVGFNDPCFSADFKWRIPRAKINSAIYQHEKKLVIQCPEPLRVPIYGHCNIVKMTFTLYHGGFGRDRDVNTTLEARLELPSCFRGHSAVGIRLELIVGAFDGSDKKPLCLLTAKASMNVQFVLLHGFVSHQQLKSSTSEYIFIRAGCKTYTDHVLEEDDEMVTIQS